jgi:hypothetical protein
LAPASSQSLSSRPLDEDSLSALTLSQWAFICIGLAALIVLVVVAGWCIWKRRKSHTSVVEKEGEEMSESDTWSVPV